MSITRLRVTASRLPQKVREAAKSSPNDVVFIPPPNKKSMAGMMTFHQALLCLQKGDVVGKPKLNDLGAWEMTMERYVANSIFRVDVVAECDGARVTRLIVLLAGR